MYETKDLKNSLRKSLEAYKEKRPDLSIRAIAKKSGVNRYFLTKLLDGNDKSNALDLNQVLILSKYITGRDSVTEAIDASPEDIRDALLRVFPTVSDSKQKLVALSLYDKVDLTDKTVYFVLVLATYGLGTKRDLVFKILGERGENILQDLLKNEVLKEEKGRIKLSSGTDFTCDFKLISQKIPDYFNFYRSERHGTQENFVHVTSEGVNKKALHEVQKIHLAAYKKIIKVLEDPKNWGDIPLFSFACMDRLSEQSLEENTEEN